LHPQSAQPVRQSTFGGGPLFGARPMDLMADRYQDAGPLMPFILVVAGVAGVIIIERVYAIIVRARVDGRSFMERSIQLVRGGKVDEALKLCTNSRTALSDIGLMILRSRIREDAELRNLAEAAALTIVPRLRHRLNYLRTLAWSAVALGILGLSLGMERALTAAAAPGLVDRLAVLAPASAVALKPFSAGLIVMIVIISFHSFLVGQADRIADQVSEYAARLNLALTDRPDVRLGHR
jgi:biopolymer transport protein ExbB